MTKSDQAIWHIWKYISEVWGAILPTGTAGEAPHITSALQPSGHHDTEMARQTKLQPGFSRLPVWSRGRRLLENAQLQTFSQRVQHRQARLGSPQAARAREGAQWRERRRRHFLSPLTALSRAGAVRGHLRHRPLRWKWHQRPAPSPSIPLSACGHLHARALRGEA